jgi:F-type H+-transporting ATPase subunit b
MRRAGPDSPRRRALARSPRGFNRGGWARVAGLALALLLAGPAWAQHEGSEAGGDPQGGHGAPAEGEGHGGGHHVTCESVAGHKLNWVDFFGWKDFNKAECAKWEADNSYHPVQVGPPLVAAFINFAILLFLLVKFARQPLATFLSSRHETVKRELKESAKRWDEAQARLAEYEQKLRGMEAARKELIAQYEEQAQREVQRLQQDFERQISKIRTDAEREIQVAIGLAEKSLRREVVEAAISTAEGILRKEIRPEDRERLLEQFIARVNARPGGQLGGSA